MADRLLFCQSDVISKPSIDEYDYMCFGSLLFYIQCTFILNKLILLYIALKIFLLHVSLHLGSVKSETYASEYTCLTSLSQGRRNLKVRSLH